MIPEAIKRIFRNKSKQHALVRGEQTWRDQMQAAMELGDRREATRQLRLMVEKDPTNLDLINNLAVRLSDLGSFEEANQLYELAYTLDETFTPALFNRALSFVDHNNCYEALKLLEELKCIEPNQSLADVVYGKIAFVAGDVDKSLVFAMRAWLQDFANLRHGNSVLWRSAYSENEATVAAEHRFWAETLDRPTNSKYQQKPADPIKQRKIRIGYLSPDFRNHSVYFFCVPLLKNHNRDEFEVFAYYDYFTTDAQTEIIKKHVDHFTQIFDLSDVEVKEKILDDRLDILVELAGHTSYNRLPLFENRLATLQISALGYPPTTGLAAIDVKIGDRYTRTEESSKHYAEYLHALPNSFWCFEPEEVIDIPTTPPVNKNGYITFGSVGNISKFSPGILANWQRILEQIPTARLLIRSVTFRDPFSLDSVKATMAESGIDLSRVDFMQPEGGRAFLESYKDIDIILDTFPFNGGTTTCFAAHMGVPVISKFGETLASRMGLSIMSNLGYPELAVPDDKRYVEVAVDIASRADFLATFRKEVRSRFASSSIGNGALYAQDFESECKALLAKKIAGTLDYQSEIPVLPARELVRRAYTAAQINQPDAARRIIEYCLRNYPNDGGAHLLVSQQIAGNQDFQSALEYLEIHIDRFSATEKQDAYINMCRYSLLDQQIELAADYIELAASGEISDAFTALQVQLYKSIIRDSVYSTLEDATSEPVNILVVIVCDDLPIFEEIKQQIESSGNIPATYHVRYLQCNEKERTETYLNLLQGDSDILIMWQKHIRVFEPMFFQRITRSLVESDVVSFSGARSWDRLDWRGQPYSDRSSASVTGSTERYNFYEVQVAGKTAGFLEADMSVLDGSLIALKRSRCKEVSPDDVFNGAYTLMEEEWVHRLYRAGRKLTVHRGLGVLVGGKEQLDAGNLLQARMSAKKRYKFDLFESDPADWTLATAPVESLKKAFQAIEACFGVTERN